MAIENYREMRDEVRDAKFQLRADLSFELERRFPERFIPRYSMVMFHPEISYAEAHGERRRACGGRFRARGKADRGRALAPRARRSAASSSAGKSGAASALAAGPRRLPRINRSRAPR
jgi:hypothetical protein